MRSAAGSIVRASMHSRPDRREPVASLRAKVRPGVCIAQVVDAQVVTGRDSRDVAQASAIETRRASLPTTRAISPSNPSSSVPAGRSTAPPDERIRGRRLEKVRGLRWRLAALGCAARVVQVQGDDLARPALQRVARHALRVYKKYTIRNGPPGYADPMPIDRTDRAIIAELAADSRLSIRTIAERVHISRTAAHNRVQNLIANGVLTGFGAQVDRKSIGLNVVAIVIVKVERRRRGPHLAAALSELPYVESVLAVSGDIDFVVTVSAPDHEHLSEVIMRQIHGMPGVVSTSSHVVLDARRVRRPECARTIGPSRAPKRDKWHSFGRSSAVCQQSVRALCRIRRDGLHDCRMSDAIVGPLRTSGDEPDPTHRAADPADRREGRAGARKARRRLRAARPRDPAVALPPDGRRPPLRDPGHRADPPGPPRDLPLGARAGGLRDRCRQRARRRRLAVPDLPRHHRAARPAGSSAVEHPVVLPRRLARRVRPERSTGSRRRRRRSPPRPCMPSVSRPPRS